MHFKALFIKPRIDFDRFRIRLKQELGEAIAHAVFEWLSATVDKVPVWSGASRATFVPLASQIGFAIALDRSPTSRRGGFGLGLRNAEGIISGDERTGIFGFIYKTTLEHLIYNEFNNGNEIPGPGQFGTLDNPGPYLFTVAGKQAFEAFAQTVRLPSPFDTFKTSRVRVK